MPNANVELSKNELELVSSSEFILTKNRIIEKVYNLYGSLSEFYKDELHKRAAVLPSDVFISAPKIYKGENYLSLPYVMMDYPRVFLKENVFAIRSFFWWGNFFSITMQLSGKFLNEFTRAILFNLKNCSEEDFFIGVNESQWHHHFETTNYKSLHEITESNMFSKLNDQPFIKIAKKISLSEWNNASEFFKKNYESLLQLIEEKI